MLRFFGLLVKFTLLSLFILVLGSLIRWNGRTVSDRIKTQIGHAERSGAASQVRQWTSQLHERASGALKNEWTGGKRGSGENTRDRQGELTRVAPAERTASAGNEEIAPNERQKLRALIRELNSSHTSD